MFAQGKLNVLPTIVYFPGASISDNKYVDNLYQTVNCSK